MNSNIVKDFVSRYRRTVEHCRTSAIRLFTSAVDSHLSIAGNCLLLVGYLISQSFFEIYNPCLVASVLILLGQFLVTLSSDAYDTVANVLLLRQLRRTFGLFRFSPNHVSIVEEFHDEYYDT